MTFTQVNRLNKIVTKGYTVKQLKVVTLLHELEVMSTNINSYTPLKSDYVDAVVTGLLVQLDPTTPTGLNYKPTFERNTYYLDAIRAELLEELI